MHVATNSRCSVCRRSDDELPYSTTSIPCSALTAERWHPCTGEPRNRCGDRFSLDVRAALSPLRFALGVTLVFSASSTIVGLDIIGMRRGFILVIDVAGRFFCSSSFRTKRSGSTHSCCWLVACVRFRPLIPAAPTRGPRTLRCSAL